MDVITYPYTKISKTMSVKGIPHAISSNWQYLCYIQPGIVMLSLTCQTHVCTPLISYHNCWFCQWIRSRIYFARLASVYNRKSIRHTSGSTLCMRPSNERWRYTVTPSLIGWGHTQNDTWCTEQMRWIMEMGQTSWLTASIFKVHNLFSLYCNGWIST